MAYTAWSVVYGEQPTAAKWNQLGTNDAGFKDGSNIDNDAILARHLADGSLESGMVNFIWAGVATGGTNVGTTRVTTATLNITLPVAAQIVALYEFHGNTNAAGVDGGAAIQADGVDFAVRQGSGGYELGQASLNDDYSSTLTGISGVLSAGSHAIRSQVFSSAANGWDAGGGLLLIIALRSAQIT